MRTSDFERYALAICVAVAMLAGCGGGVHSELAPSGSFQQSTARSVVKGAAQTGYVGILGGGPIYKHIQKNIEQLKHSGFNELIVWSVEVGATGGHRQAYVPRRQLRQGGLGRE